MAALRKIGKDELQKILRRHELWVCGEPRGQKAKLSGMDFSGVNLRDCCLAGAEFYGANLRRAILMSADLSNANLDGADLSGAYLRCANLSGSSLRNTICCKADFRGANLTNANLVSANFADVMARGAYFDSAQLMNAVLTNANLNRAKFRGANLRGVKWDDKTNFVDTVFDGAIGLPPGFPVPGAEVSSTSDLDRRFPFHRALLFRLDPVSDDAEDVKEYLRALQAFIEFGNFTQASDKLTCSRQTVANYIAKLGRILHLQLTRSIVGKGAPQALPTEDARLVNEWIAQHKQLLG